MSESTRKHRFHWDMKDDIQPPSELGEQNAWTRRERHSGFDDGLRPKFSDLDVNNVSKNSRDYSGLSSLEQLQGNSTAKRDDDGSKDRQKFSENTRAWDDHKSYCKSMSPDDDKGQRTKSPSPFRGRDRSRGWARGRSRSGGKNRSCSRSRSRSRGKLRHWSGSPVHGHRRESYGPNDKRRTGSGMPSQPCKDFAAGKCRRGSQCRFLHQSNHEYRHRGHPERNSMKRWRSRSEHGDALKDSNTRGLRDFPRDVSDGDVDGYGRGEPQPVKNNSKAKISCRDFLKGKCRWGASCRFSHDDASNDNYLRGNRNSSFVHGQEHQANRSGKLPCKFFAMGECHRDDCRFSHDDQKSRNIELRSSSDRWVHDADSKNISWTGPTWEEATCVSGITKSTGWDKSLALEKCLPDPLTAEKRTDGEWSHVSEKEKSTWNGKKRFDGASMGDESQECGNNGSGMGTTEFMEKIVYKEELQFNSEGPQSQIWDTNIHGTNGTRQLSNTVTEPTVSETSFYQKLQGGNISRSGFHNALPDVECYANTSHSVSVPEQGFNKKFDCMGSQPLMSSSGSSQSQHILSLYRQSFDLNGTVQHIFSPLVLQKKMELNHEETFKTQEGLELEVPPVTSEVSQNVLTSEKFTQISSFPASEGFGNGQQLPPYDARLDGTKSELMMFCPSSASPIPVCDSMILECNPTLPSKPNNSNQDPGFLPASCQQNNHMPSEQLVLPSLVNHASSMIQQCDGLKEEYHMSPKSKQQEPVNDAKAYSKDEHMIAEKCMQKEENLHSETIEAEHRIDEGMNSKDDKVMRLFKIALVEFVKEILKPTWKEGKMSREVHKTIVKKVVDKVTNTIQGDHVPKTQDKIDQYLSFSKPKITKLVQAYMERFLKN